MARPVRTPTPAIAARLREMAGARPLALVPPPTAQAERLDLSHFGTALQLLQLRLGLTQSEVARLADIPRERGSNPLLWTHESAC